MIMKGRLDKTSRAVITQSRHLHLSGYAHLDLSLVKNDAARLKVAQRVHGIVARHKHCPVRLPGHHTAARPASKTRMLMGML